MFGNGWRLVLAPGTGVPAAAASFPGVRVLRSEALNETEGVLAAWFGKNALAGALVRPDNYVFGVALRADQAGPLLEEAAAALGFNKVIE